MYLCEDMFVVSQIIFGIYFRIICDGIMTKGFVCCCSKFLTFICRLYVFLLVLKYSVSASIFICELK